MKPYVVPVWIPAKLEPSYVSDRRESQRKARQATATAAKQAAKQAAKLQALKQAQRDARRAEAKATEQAQREASRVEAEAAKQALREARRAKAKAIKEAVKTHRAIKRAQDKAQQQATEAAKHEHVDRTDTLPQIAQLEFDCSYKFRVYKEGAIKRSLIFDLTLEQASVMFNAPCHYCEYLPRHEFNGIDRVENTVGYTAENCVACCKWCNRAKGHAPLEAFMEWIRWILANKTTSQRWHPAA